MSPERPDSAAVATPRPLVADLPPQAQWVLEGARILQTQHACGQMVWHAWGTGEPLVLLHGGSGSWTHWLRNVESLAASGRTVWVPDLPGCGDSDPPPEGHDADALVEPLAQGLGHLFGPAPVDLAGFSFGGLCAGLLASAHPGRLRRLVLVGAPVLALGARPVRLMEWRHLPTAQERAAVHRANLAALMLHHRASITPLAVALHAANLARDRLRRRRMARGDALQRALQSVALPVAAIYGREDALYRDRTEALEAALRQAPALASIDFIPDAGHWVQFEAPQRFDELLLRALARMA
ncbi:alpha/beta fold hydrolase [Ramlibacter sp. AN1015]|uniref:alpha/beta fold hydrolase n=1 Tax=Ramlibacter sp. AN1015 TaxID=3133428 RepID=UPI0030C5C0ED